MLCLLIFILCMYVLCKPDNNLQASLVDLGTLFDPLVQYRPRKSIRYSKVYIQIIMLYIKYIVNMSPALPLTPVSPSPHLGPATPEAKQQKTITTKLLFFSKKWFGFFYSLVVMNASTFSPSPPRGPDGPISPFSPYRQKEDQASRFSARWDYQFYHDTSRVKLHTSKPFFPISPFAPWIPGKPWNEVICVIYKQINKLRHHRHPSDYRQ